MTLLQPAIGDIGDIRDTGDIVGSPPDRDLRVAAWLTRRRLRAAVGILWLLAGALQLQPFMFTGGFADDVLGSAAVSQPTPLHGLITSVERLVSAQYGSSVRGPAAWSPDTRH